MCICFCVYTYTCVGPLTPPVLPPSPVLSPHHRHIPACRASPLVWWVYVYGDAVCRSWTPWSPMWPPRPSSGQTGKGGIKLGQGTLEGSAPYAAGAAYSLINSIPTMSKCPYMTLALTRPPPDVSAFPKGVPGDQPPPRGRQHGHRGTPPRQQVRGRGRGEGGWLVAGRL